LGGKAYLEMNESDVLLSMAEIGVALLGFAAIVSVFRQRDTWRPDGRFWAMVAAGVGTLVFSLLPLPFLFRGIDPPSIWQTCSALFGLYALGYCVLLTGSFKRDRAASSSSSIPIFAVVFAGSAFTCPFLLASAAGYLGAPSFWSYLVGLVWFQILTTILFVRLLVVWLR
jgi:hypothetical protein